MNPQLIARALLCVLMFTSCGSSKQDQEKRPPNIVIIFTDDQGYQDVGCFGSPDIETPNLDQMAKEGVRLTSFSVAQAVCSASRTALLTGCYPNRLGIHGALMPNAKVGINSSETTMAEMLKSEGYNTAIFGKWHLGDATKFLPLQHGFDEYFGIPYSNDMWPLHPQQGPVFDFGPLPLYDGNTIIDTLTDQSNLTTQITDRSVDFIKRNKDKPFFLYVPHPQPHVPLFVSDKFKGKSERGLYGDVIMELDWSTGEILKALKETGADDNTLVIYTSDNGPWLAYGNHAGSALPFREGKGTAWEGGHREPFIARFPGKIPSNIVSDVPVMAIDVLPTIAGLVDAELPSLPIDGKDAWTVLTGESNESPQEAYFYYYHRNELHAVRKGKWKLYFPHRYRSMNGQEPGGDGLPGQYTHFNVEELELYNLNQDIGETSNVIKQHPDIVSELSKLADGMRTKLGDSLMDMAGEESREVGKI